MATSSPTRPPVVRPALRADARRPAAPSGPDAMQRATIFLLVTGIAVLVAVLVQFGWAAAASAGLVTTSVASLLVANFVAGAVRVLLGGWLTVAAMRRAFHCRPPWSQTLQAQLVGVLLGKAALLGLPAAMSMPLLLLGFVVPGLVIVRRAG